MKLPENGGREVFFNLFGIFVDLILLFLVGTQ